MSGGSLNYFYCQLEDHIGDFGDRELDGLVHDLAELFHDRECYLSGDTGPGDWNEARDAFKAKWFTREGRKKRIDRYLTEAVEEMRKSIGISEKYCSTCRHYTPNGGESHYGKCEYVSGCLMHRSEDCEKWEKKT